MNDETPDGNRSTQIRVKLNDFARPAAEFTFSLLQFQTRVCRHTRVESAPKRRAKHQFEEP